MSRRDLPTPHCPVCMPAGCHVHGDGNCDAEAVGDPLEYVNVCRECEPEEHEHCHLHRCLGCGSTDLTVRYLLAGVAADAEPRECNGEFHDGRERDIEGGAA